MKNPRLLLSALSLVATGAFAATACTSDSAQNPVVSAKDSGGPRCGDGTVDTGETCDTSIADGKTGACPKVASCDDDDACTVNAVLHGGSCTAACDYSAKTAASLDAKDGCCPSGATVQTDSDCNPNCGNAKLDTSELCDPGIASGTGACPTSCPDDGDPCTTASLVTADPCNPRCTTATTTTPKDGDGCCPAGANGSNDSDCSATCGNGVVEGTEQCDEPAATCKSCKFVPTAFRFTALSVASPSLYLYNATDGSCPDITSAVNGLIDTNLTDDSSGSADGGADGTLDMSFVLFARPLDQASPSGAGEFLASAVCPAPAPPSSCGPDGTAVPQKDAVTNKSTGTCLTSDPTLYTGPDGSANLPNTPQAGTDGCFVSSGAPLHLTISGIQLTFDIARVSAEWVGTPATGMTHGLVEAFMSATQAAAIILPPAVGSQPLSALLRGSADNGCTGDDTRLGPDGKTSGYWFYFDFEAQKVDWTGN